MGYLVSLKKLSSEVERLRSEVNKKEKACNTANKKLEELRPIQQ